MATWGHRWSSLGATKRVRVCRKEPGQERGGGRRRRRRSRENPGCISDAAIHPPVPCPLLISSYKYLFHTWTRALEQQAPHDSAIDEELRALEFNKSSKSLLSSQLVFICV